MKHILFTLLPFFLIIQTLPGQTVQIFEKNGKYGLRGTSGKVIVKTDYDYIYPLNQSHYLVEKGNKIGLISESGAIVLDPIFDDIQELNSTDYIVTDNSKWGVVTRHQRIIVPLEYTGIDKLSDYLYIINKGEKKGLMDKSGRVVHPPYYDDITNLSDLLYLLKNGQTISLIDNLGNTVMSGNYDSFEKLQNSHLYKVASGNKKGIIDLSGKLNVDPIYDDIDCTDDNFIILKKDGKYGFVINYKHIPPTFDKIVFMQKNLGVVVVRKGNLNGFVTTQGQIIQPVYENISRFGSNGHAFVERKGQLMYVDTSGKEKTLQEVSGNVRF